MSQENERDHSNSRVLKRLDINRAIVTIDAMEGQKQSPRKSSIANPIIQNAASGGYHVCDCIRIRELDITRQ
jgi:predicted transposase YbfD/YdcC